MHSFFNPAAMEEDLVKQFIAKYPFLFNADRWFWEQELLQLLDQYLTALKQPK